MELNRALPELRDCDVVDYLLLHTKVIEHDLTAVSEEDETIERKEPDSTLADRMMAAVDDVLEVLGDSIFGSTTSDQSDDEVPSEIPKFSTFHSAPHKHESSSGALPQLNIRAKSLPNRYPVEASNEEKHTRRISGHRFSAIMSSTPYDVTALMKDLVDEDG